jgi:hypothetical protein
VAERRLAWADGPFGLGELEAEAEAGRPVQHQVLAVDLLGGGFCQGGGVDDGRSADQGGVYPGDAAGTAVRAGGRALRGSPPGSRRC